MIGQGAGAWGRDMDTRTRRLGLMMAAAVGFGLVVLPADAAPPPTCGTPVMATPPAFASGDENTVSWTAPSPTGGGFVLAVSASPALNADGSFQTVEQTDGSLSSSTVSHTVSGLSESTHYYQVRAKTRSGACIASAWSGVVATTQDSTGPVATIVTPTDGQLVAAEPFTVTGTLTDAGSGPADATVTITNTTAGIDVLFPAQSLTVDARSGTWTATFPGLAAGRYTIDATGVDQLGHVSAEADQVSVVVLSA